MKKLKGSITVSRPSCGNGKEYISIQVQDKNSRLHFLEIELDYSSFTKMLTGLAFVDCDLIVRDIENVGKTKEQKIVTFEIPEKYKYARNETLKQIAKPYIPNGWYSDLYFESKDSTYIDQKTNKTYGRMTVYRFIDEGI